MRTERYTYLDLIRGLSAIAVLIIHYRLFYSHGGRDMPLPDSLPLISVLRPVYAYGSLAVQAFWMLSGVIFFIKYGGGNIDVRKFAVWRFARLYPLHLATLLLVTAIQFYSLRTFGTTQIYLTNNDTWHFLLHLFMASNWRHPLEFSFNGVIWSVSLEVLTYALFVAYVQATAPRLWKTVGAFAALATAYGLTGNLIPLCGALFFLGGVMVQLRLARWPAVASIAIALSALGTLLVTGANLPTLYFVAVPAVLLIALTLDGAAPPVPKAARWIGDITYSTYLMHMPILMCAKMWLDQQPNRDAILDSPLALFAWLGTVIVVGIAVHRLFELPAQKWIQDRFHAGRARSAIEREEMRTI